MKIPYKDIEFGIKNTSIDVLNAGMPLFVEYRKAQALYLDDIDTSLIDSYTEKIQLFKTTVKQLESLKPDDIYDEQISNEQKIAELKSKIIELENEFSENAECQITLKLKSDIEAMILGYIIQRKSIMSKLFNVLLIGDVSKIDYEDSEYSLFAVKVLEVFFSMSKKKNKK